MTNEEASFCMKQYLSDSDSLECMKCPYYHTVPIEGTENGFTCKADEAHKIAIKALETIPKYKDAYNKGWDDGAKATYEHLKMCEEEQGGDLISRDMALEKMADYVASGYADSVEDFEEYSRIICQLPSVNPQPICEDAISRQKVLDVINLNWDYRRNCIRAIEKLPPVNPQEPKWIPVSERLPEENGQYLITVKYKPEADYENIYAEHGEWIDGQWDMFCFGHCGEVEDIVAWMPLPKPYKAESDNCN